MLPLEIVKDYQQSNGSAVQNLTERVRCFHQYVFSSSGKYYILLLNMFKPCLDINNVFRKKQIERETKFFTSYQEIYLSKKGLTNLSIFANASEYLRKRNFLPPFVEASFRSYSPDKFIIRLVNLHDSQTAYNISILESDGSIPLLSSLSGLAINVKAQGVEEISLNTILSKEKVLKEKVKIREAGEINIGSLLIKSNEKFI